MKLFLFPELIIDDLTFLLRTTFASLASRETRLPLPHGLAAGIRPGSEVLADYSLYGFR